MVVVYGSHISSLTVIHCVHDMIGSDSINRIVWVQPNPTTALFPDPVQSTLDSVLDGIGVIRYPGCVLDRYVTNTDSDELTGIVCVRVVDEETKEVEEVEIECKVRMFVCYMRKNKPFYVMTIIDNTQLYAYMYVVCVGYDLLGKNWS